MEADEISLVHELKQMTCPAVSILFQLVKKMQKQSLSKREISVSIIHSQVFNVLLHASTFHRPCMAA